MSRKKFISTNPDLRTTSCLVCLLEALLWECTRSSSNTTKRENYLSNMSRLLIWTNTWDCQEITQKATTHSCGKTSSNILITGSHKAFALYKAIEEGVNHMWTVSAFQM